MVTLLNIKNPQRLMPAPARKSYTPMQRRTLALVQSRIADARRMHAIGWTSLAREILSNARDCLKYV